MWELFSTHLPRRCRHCAELMMMDWAGVLLCSGGCDAEDLTDPPCDCDMYAEDSGYVEINIDEMSSAPDPYLYFQALIREALSQREDDDD